MTTLALDDDEASAEYRIKNLSEGANRLKRTPRGQTAPGDRSGTGNIQGTGGR